MKRHVFVSIVAMVILSLLMPLARASASTARFSGGWTMAPSMPAPLMSHQAVMLHDGRVLVLGGESVLGVPTRTAQVYDPATRAWTTLIGMHTARIGFTATVLLDGRVLVVGGIGTQMQDLASAELFDPRAERWSELPALPQSRFSQSASLLPDGRVLLVGGIVNHVIGRSTLLFDPIRDSFVPGPLTRFPHAQQDTLTMPDQKILIAGGYGGTPEVYDPSASAWQGAGSTPLRIHPTLTLLPNGTVLLVGGTDRAEHDSTLARIFHPSDDRWTDTAALPVRQNAGISALLPDGQVLIAGGEQVDHHVLKAADVFDVAAQAWRPTAPLHIARSGSTSTLLSDGTILICGGGGFAGALSSCEVYHA
jgi:hypothetical protein